MKKIKIAMGLAAFIAATALIYSFRTTQPKPVDNPHWEFNGSTVAQETDATQYSLITGSEPDCNGSGLNCVIAAPEDPSNPGQPDLSQMSGVSKRN